MAGSESRAREGRKRSGLEETIKEGILHKSIRLRLRNLAEENKKQEVREAVKRLGPSLARQAGFEPTTPWFVAKYSIQLSYWRNIFLF